MAVELFTLYGKLEADSKQFQDSLRAADARLDSTAQKVSATEQRSKSLGITTATSARSYEKLNERLAVSQARLAATATAFSKGEVSAKQMASALYAVDKAALAVSNRVKDAEARLTDFQNKASKTSKSTGFSSSDVLSIGALYGAGRAVEAAIDRTREAENANRALTASATEAGKSYSQLATEALSFGKSANLSNVEAEKSAATLQRLLTLAGKSNEFEKFSKGFLDVAAARGVDIRELDTLFQGIISGTDDALNRFGKQDPSKLAEQYAKSIGKTVEQLTEQEKILSRLKAFEPDFELFAGKNAEKLGSVSGEADAAAKSIDDLKTNLALAATQSLEFQQALSSVNEILKAIASYDPIDIRIRLQKGESPQALAEEVADGTFNSILDRLKVGANAIFGLPAFYYDLLTKGADDAARNYQYATDPNTYRQLRVDDLVSKFTKEQQSLQTQYTQSSVQYYTNLQNQQLAAFNAQNDPKALKKQADELEKVRKEAERLQKELDKARDAFRDIRADALATIQDNPSIKELNDIAKGAKNAYQQTLPLGRATAEAAANYVRLAGAVKLASQALDKQLSSIDYRQQARLAALTPASEMNGVPRRLDTLEKGLNLLHGIADSQFKSQQARSFARNPFITSDPNYETNEVYNDILDAESLFSKFDALARDLGNLGSGGQSILAQAKLARLPSVDTLLKVAQDQNPYNYRASSAARRALSDIGNLNSTLAKTQEVELKNLLAKNKVIQDTAIPFALEKLNAIKSSSAPNQAKLDAFLAVTGELGSEITPDLLKARINALNEKASIEESYRKDLLGAIKKLAGTVNEEGQVRVGLSNQYVTKVDVNGVKATVTTEKDSPLAPTTKDVNSAMDNPYSGAVNYPGGAGTRGY